MSRGQVTLNDEADFHLEELFFSTTDQNGVIQHGNDVFVRVSGYGADELFGSPHSIIRHPDTPRIVFKLLWDSIQRGGTIAAYVKNLAKDGRFYWVLAVAMPCDGGYLSIRLKPSSKLFPVVQSLYSRLLTIERAIEREPKQRLAAMRASADELTKQLCLLGFDNYESFMLQALSDELASRQRLLSEDNKRLHLKNDRNLSDHLGLFQNYESCVSIDEQLMVMFERLDEFKSMSLQLVEKSQTVLTSAESIRTLSLNASVAANRLGPSAGTLRVIADSLGTVSNDSQSVINELSNRMMAVVEVLNQLIFDVAATKLQSEVSLQFFAELFGSSRDRTDSRVEASLKILFGQIDTRVQKVFSHLKGTEDRMCLLLAQIEKLLRNNRILSFVQFAGQKESAACNDSDGFLVVFDEVRNQIESIKNVCDFLDLTVREVFNRVRHFANQRQQFAGASFRFDQIVTAAASSAQTCSI